MNELRPVEHALSRWLADAASGPTPTTAIEDAIAATRPVRQRPGWLANLKESPMRFHARTAVGSPALRLTALTALLIVVLAAAGGLVAGAASLLPSPQVDDGPVAPSWQALQPTAVFDLPNATDVISLATDGSTVWAAGAGQLLRIDGATNAVQYLDAPVASGDTGLLSADDGLWAARYRGGKVYRLDPATGAVDLEAGLSGATNLQLVGDQLWVGRAYASDMVRVDRVTGVLGDDLPVGKHGAGGLASPDSLWFFAPGVTSTLTRIDVASGETLATIELPTAPACVGLEFGGTYPDAIYAGCYFGVEAAERPFVRIDPDTNAIAATTVLPSTHGAAPVVLDGQVWLAGSFQADDGTPFGGMVRVDPTTGAVKQWVSLGDIDPDPPVAADGAIWVGDDGGQQVLRFDPSSIAGQ